MESPAGMAWNTQRYYGLHNFTYEGGPSMTDRNQIDLPNMLAANADLRMGQEVTQALTGAFQDGVDVYMYFTSSGAWSQYGIWGATDDILDLTQPKWQALQALAGKPITRTLAVTAASSGYPAGTTLPGTIPVNPPTFTVTNDSIETQPWIVMNCGTPAVCALKGTATPGTGFAYLVNVPKAGNYAFSLVMYDGSSTPDGSIALDVDQKPVGSFTVTQTPAGTPQTVGPVNVTLTSGLHLIEILQAGTYNFSASRIMVTAG